MATEEAEAGTAVALTSYGRPLTAVSSFKFLGQVLSESDDNWLVVIQNFWRARQKWAGQEGANERTLGMFYTVVVPVVLLYGL